MLVVVHFCRAWSKAPRWSADLFLICWLSLSTIKGTVTGGVVLILPVWAHGTWTYTLTLPLQFGIYMYLPHIFWYFYQYLWINWGSRKVHLPCGREVAIHGHSDDVCQSNKQQHIIEMMEESPSHAIMGHKQKYWILILCDGIWWIDIMHII